MDIKHIHFRDHILFFTLVPLIILISIFSYYRFFISNDYVIKYEAECDPFIADCFVGCEDEECAEEYYYFYVQKYAANLYQQCGEDITDCETASVCLPSESKCSIIYCNTETDGDLCEILTEETEIQDINNETLQNNKPINN